MPTSSWLRTDVGRFVVRPFVTWPWSARLQLSLSSAVNQCDIRKAPFQLNESRDLPLLRQILRSEFVSHSQLLEFMRLNHHERSRNSFDWGPKMAGPCELVRRQTMRGCAGEFVYSIASSAALLAQE